MSSHILSSWLGDNTPVLRDLKIFYEGMFFSVLIHLFHSRALHSFWVGRQNLHQFSHYFHLFPSFALRQGQIKGWKVKTCSLPSFLSENQNTCYNSVWAPLETLLLGFLFFFNNYLSKRMFLSPHEHDAGKLFVSLLSIHTPYLLGSDYV